MSELDKLVFIRVYLTELSISYDYDTDVDLATCLDWLDQIIETEETLNDN